MGCVASSEPKPDAGNRLRRDGGYDDDFPDDEGYNGSSATKSQQQQQHRNAPANGTDNGRASHPTSLATSTPSCVCLESSGGGAGSAARGTLCSYSRAVNVRSRLTPGGCSLHCHQTANTTGRAFGPGRRSPRARARRARPPSSAAVAAHHAGPGGQGPADAREEEARRHRRRAARLRRVGRAARHFSFYNFTLSVFTVNSTLSHYAQPVRLR